MLPNSPMFVVGLWKTSSRVEKDLLPLALDPTSCWAQWKGKFICSFLPISHFRVFLWPHFLWPLVKLRSVSWATGISTVWPPKGRPSKLISHIPSARAPQTCLLQVLQGQGYQSGLQIKKKIEIISQRKLTLSCGYIFGDILWELPPTTVSCPGGPEHNKCLLQNH